MGEILLTN